MAKHPKSIFVLLLAMCVLLTATVGAVAPLCSAVGQSQHIDDCHAVMAEECHGTECAAHWLPSTIAHACCLNLAAVLPSLGSLTVPDQRTQAIPFFTSFNSQSHAERLFRPPRTLS